MLPPLGGSYLPRPINMKIAHGVATKARNVELYRRPREARDDKLYGRNSILRHRIPARDRDVSAGHATGYLSRPNATLSKVTLVGRLCTSARTVCSDANRMSAHDLEGLKIIFVPIGIPASPAGACVGGERVRRGKGRRPSQDSDPSNGPAARGSQDPCTQSRDLIYPSELCTRFVRWRGTSIILVHQWIEARDRLLPWGRLGLGVAARDA